jgi:hypothetical protein
MKTENDFIEGVKKIADNIEDSDKYTREQKIFAIIYLKQMNKAIRDGFTNMRQALKTTYKPI